MMCMGMSTTWMVLSSLLMCFIVLGFGYIILTIAAKESGNIKLAGQIISIVIIVLAVLLCVYGGMKGGKMRGQNMMMKQEMMKQDMMKQGMDKHEMKKMMKDSWKK